MTSATSGDLKKHNHLKSHKLKHKEESRRQNCLNFVNNGGNLYLARVL